MGGKNLVPNNWTQGMISTSDGVTISENPYWVYTEDYIPIDNKFTVSFKETCMACLFLYDENKNFISFYQAFKTDPYATFNHPNQKYFRIGYNLSGMQEATTPTTIYNHEPMAEYGDVATTYEPYITPTSYQLSLGNRKIFEVDYLWIDKTTGKKYHHHTKGTYTMTGEEDIQMQNNNTRFGFELPTASKDSTKASSILVLCNRFIGISFNDRNSSSVADNGVYQVCNNVSNSIQFNTGAKFVDKDAFKAYCRNNNVDLVYTLATETDEEITGTLAEQLEEWWNGQSLDGTTIIEGNGDLPMIIKVRALKGE